MAAATCFLGATNTSTACFHLKPLPFVRLNNDHLNSSLRLAPASRPPLFWVKKSNHGHTRWWPSFFSSWAAVAQEEAAVVDERQGEDVVAQEKAAAAAADERQGEEEGKETAPSAKLYFGNLPYSCDSAQLAAIVQEYGSPELVEVLYDRSTGRSRGFAFVTMSSVQDANAVIQNLDGSEYGGRTLRVNFSDKPRPREPLYPETEFKLFVGNLSWRVTSESLTEVFSGCGNVVGARVLYDGETGRSRGYGFVCYSSQSEMDAALDSLNGVELDGRQLRISHALGKKS